MEGHTFVHLIHRYYPYRGGSENYFQALSERLVADGSHVHLVTTDAWDLEYFWNPEKQRVSVPFQRHNGVKIHRVPAKHLPAANFTHRAIRRGMGEISRFPLPGRESALRALSRFGPWLPDLPRLLERIGQKASLIHPANIALESMISDAADFARSHDIPLLITPKLHLGEQNDSRVRRYYTMPHQLELLRRADRIMTQTTIEADFLVKHGVDEGRISVVGLGIDIDRVTGGDGDRARAHLGIDGPMVLCLGAAAYDKGTIHACKAILELNRTRSERVTVVVAGPIMSDFQRFADSLTEKDRRSVRVLGYVEDEMRTDLLAACDVLSLASRTEAFGYVFLEAWANGKPVIGARAGGIPAVVTDQKDGLLVDFGDVAALGSAIEAIVSDQGFATALGANGQIGKVVDTASWYGKVKRVYADVLGVGDEERVDGEPAVTTVS